MARDSSKERSITKNRKARHSYHVLEEKECGLVLQGTEVKSLRAGRASIQEAYARFKDGELWLVGANIPEYSHGNIHNHAPERDRKILMARRELEKWAKAVKEQGTTMVPLELLFAGHLVKLRLGLCKGKKLYDKREDQKQRTAKREMDRAMRRR